MILNRTDKIQNDGGKYSVAQTPGNAGPAFEDVAAQRAQNPDISTHCVPCPCQECCEAGYEALGRLKGSVSADCNLTRERVQTKTVANGNA